VARPMKLFFSIIVSLLILIAAYEFYIRNYSSHEIEVSGFYHRGFEKNDFKPRHSFLTWWITSKNKELYSQYEKLRPQETVFARLKGIKSSIGMHGHLNLYFYEFKVEDVIELRSISPNDCL
jgi:hypothetical protein